jgi:nicotinamidase-related amidase
MPTDSAHGREMLVPAFYDPKHAREWDYAPNQQAVFEAANDFRRAHGLRPASDDALKVHLVLVDVQKDFCFPRGSLYVGGRSGTGAMDDSDRIARFIYRNVGAISEITCTMDTHFPFQIFFPSFWVDADGKPLQPYREVTAEQVRAGEALPNPAIAAWVSGGDYDWLRRQAEFYCEELEREGKYRLYLWPPHCLTGSDGHPLAGVIHEARLFHAFARSARNGVEIKGGHPLTENYSVLSPEVLTRFDGGALAARNADFIRTLLEADVVVVAGQAASHCVKSTIEDLLDEVRAVDESLVRKVVILEDCMSAVTVPDPLNPGAFLADYTAEAEAALARFAAAGMRVAKSTDAVEGWLAGVV